MKIEQLYTRGLAEASYYIECNGEAAIIDPLRDPQPYLTLARKNKAKIRFILETHFHADFVSGHQELAEKTGATIVFGPTATPMYKAHVAKDGEILSLGDCSIRVMHTPGHSLESSTYLLKDNNDKDYAIFTGDTLFIDDVGRPDLVQRVKAEMTPDFLAGLLFDSLRNKIIPLADEVLVYPGHGAGSACGRKIGEKTFDSLGRQKQTNFALSPDITRDEFIRRITENLAEPPAYYPFNILMNATGDIPDLEEVLKKGNRALSSKDFYLQWQAEDAVVIDTRQVADFQRQYIPGSLFIGLCDDFSSWVGNVVKDIRQPILLVTEKGRERESIIHLSRIGYHNIIGYLKEGVKGWSKDGFETTAVPVIGHQQYAGFTVKEPGVVVLDLRTECEYKAHHLPQSINMPLESIPHKSGQLQKSRSYLLYCDSGYRATIAYSLLKLDGFQRVTCVEGDLAAVPVL